MKIRFKIAISGTVHGLADGVKPGDVIEVTDEIGARYCQMHYAEPVVDRKEEHAQVPKAEERAEPEPEPERRPPGRPRKT